MTTSERIKREAEEITARTGLYLPPYRMNEMMNTAQRITNILTTSTVGISYAECRMILHIVEVAIDEVTGKEDNHA